MQLQLAQRCTYQPDDTLADFLAWLVGRSRYDNLIATNVPKLERQFVNEEHITSAIHSGKH